MKVTFLIGNGFDLKLGLETKYSDFLKKYKRKKSSNNHIKKFADAMCGGIETWGDAEEALGKITTKFRVEDYFIEGFGNFGQKLAEYIAREQNKLVYEDYDLIRKGLADSLLDFSKYFKSSNMDMPDTYKKDVGTEVNFINFNYTDTLKRILDTVRPNGLESKNGKSCAVSEPIQIHGAVSDNVTFGVNDGCQIYNKNFRKSDVFKELFIKPQVNNKLRLQDLEDAKNRIEESDIVCVFGMSLGETDKFWWEYIIGWLAREKDRVVIIFKKKESNTFLATQTLTWQRETKEKFIGYAHSTEREIISPKVLVCNSDDIFNFEKAIKLKNTGSKSGETGNKRSERLSSVLKEYTGKLMPREQVEEALDSPQARYMYGKSNLVRTLNLVCYTGASIINPKGVVADRRKNAQSMSACVLDMLKDEEFFFNLVMINPFSKAAQEAIGSEKLGNQTFANSNETEFKSAYKAIKKALDNQGSVYAECYNRGNFTCKLTDIALPYAMMQVEYKGELEKNDYIKLDLYSHHMNVKGNSLRRSVIISKTHQPLDYAFFAKEIEDILRDSVSIKDFTAPAEKVSIHRNEKIEEKLKQYYRQYLSGAKPFGGKNIDNCISFLEMGISNYSYYSVDTPHYHKTTSEHYYILEGEQKILDIESKTESVVGKGDFVFIPAGLKHWTKNQAGTKIIFAKTPFGNDKTEMKKEELANDIVGWGKSY